MGEHAIGGTGNGNPAQLPFWKSGVSGNRKALELMVFPVMVSACLGFHTSVYSLSHCYVCSFIYSLYEKRQ